MKFEQTWTGNFENAFHGLRHPMESYAKSDSGYECTAPNWGKEEIQLCDPKCCDPNCRGVGKFILGSNDLDLAQRMIKAGTPNDKFLRQIFVSVDITAPLYIWKEIDQYKIGTTTNSTSTMHKLATTPITIDCFEMDDFHDFTIYDKNYDVVFFKEKIIIPIINHLESLRLKYLETKDIHYWKELIRWLPESWLQTRTFTCNYAVLRNIIHWRRGHKLSEWKQFIDWCKTLPYSKELLFYVQDK